MSAVAAAIGILLSAVAGGLLAGPASAREPAPLIAVRAGRLVNVERGAVLASRTTLVRSERIERIQPGKIAFLVERGVHLASNSHARRREQHLITRVPRVA